MLRASGNTMNSLRSKSNQFCTWMPVYGFSFKMASAAGRGAGWCDPRAIINDQFGTAHKSSLQKSPNMAANVEGQDAYGSLCTGFWHHILQRRASNLGDPIIIFPFRGRHCLSSCLLCRHRNGMIVGRITSLRVGQPDFLALPFADIWPYLILGQTSNE